MLTEGAGGELQHRCLYAGGGALSPARGGLGKLEKAGARDPPDVSGKNGACGRLSVTQ